MRILSIGFPLPNVAIDNYSALTAASYNDYDVLVIDPASITRDVNDLLAGAKTFDAQDGRPVLNAPTTATTVSATDQLRRRSDETARLLEAGGLVVALGRPDATIGGLLGFEGCDRYHWLPAPAGMAWGPPFLKAAEGKTVRIAAEQHPFSEVLREHRKEVTYRAMFDDRQAEVRRHGRTIAKGGAGIPIGMEFTVLGGLATFIPVLFESSGANRTALAQAIVDACRRLSGSEYLSEAPYWVRTMALPGLEQVEAELEEAQAEADQAVAHVTAVRERHDDLARHRRLLWEDGQPFAQAVTESLRMLGFTVTSAPLEPILVESEGVTAFAELESDREQVVEWPYVRLQRRLEEHLLKQGTAPKGIVIANGYREKDPDQREDELSEPLRIACENYRYSLLTSRTLFELVRRVLGGADDAALLGLRRRIMSGSGHLSLETLLGEATEETSDAGPIF
jgi:hypothetical protein